RAIAEQGTRWFYNGPFAQTTAHWMAENGGLITVQDFRNYKVLLREPIVTRYRGWQIICFPPSNSGGVHVAQILNVLERFDLGHTSEPQRLHLVAESMKMAFADRAHWLGDPDFSPVPVGLVNSTYGAELASKIRPDRTTAVSSFGLPP